MKKLIERFFLTGLAVIALTTAVSAAENLVNNPDFEEPVPDGTPPTDLFAVPGWFHLGGYFNNYAYIGAPAAGPQRGLYAAELSFNNPSITPPYINNVTFLAQRLFINDRLTAQPGEEFYASAHILREIAPGPGISLAQVGLAFYDSSGAQIDDMAPESISKGARGGCPYPGINSDYDPAGALNSWQFLQAQGVAASAGTIIVDCMVKAPHDAVEVGIFLFNINNTEALAPVWFDNVFLARLEPDDDRDRLANGIDNDPLNTSVDFSDALYIPRDPSNDPKAGTTSGTIVADSDQILNIDDEENPEGVRIIASPGSGAAARIRVCDSSATLIIRPNNELVVTCGSVILAVEEGPAVTMEIDLNGEQATVEVPPDNTVTFAPEVGKLAVESTSPTPEAVILNIGESSIPIIPGEEIELPSVLIDVKPGSYPNCFNIDGNGVVPVAILGNESFDTGTIDQSALAFGGLGVRVKGDGNPSCGMDDTNADGYPDLVCHFEDNPSNWNPGSASATLSGALLDGTSISGTDSICIVL